MSGRRAPVPFLPAGAAIVDGLPAAVISAVLERSLRRVLREEFAGLHPRSVAEVEAAVEAVDRAAGWWRSRLNASAGDLKRECADAAGEGPMGTADAARLLGVTPGRLAQLARSGVVGEKSGGRWRFTRDEVQAFAEAREAE